MSAPAPAGRPQTSVWSMYRAIVGIGLLCALLIVTVFQSTAARIRSNQEEALRRAIADVLPGATEIVPVDLDADAGLRRLAEPAGDLPVFLGYAADGTLIGSALSAIGMGYQDNIRVLYAYTFERRAITGFKVLESKETPGLGDKIEKEAHFVANFVALDAALNADGDALANAIEAVAQGEKTEAWQVDGITGATISSVAVADLLNESAQRWIPVLERDARDLDAGEER